MPGIVVIPVVLVFPHSGHPKMAKCEFSLQKMDVLGPQSFLGAGEPIVMGVTPLTNDNAKTSVGEDLM